MRLSLLRWAACLHVLGLRPDLRIIENGLRTLLILEATRFVSRPKRQFVPRPPPGIRLARPKRGARDLAAGALIRRTRRRGPHKRLMALWALIANFPQAVRKVAKRMSAGLARPRLVMERSAPIAPSHGAPAAAVAIADSS